MKLPRPDTLWTLAMIAAVAVVAAMMSHAYQSGLRAGFAAARALSADSPYPP